MWWVLGLILAVLVVAFLRALLKQPQSGKIDSFDANSITGELDRLAGDRLTPEDAAELGHSMHEAVETEYSKSVLDPSRSDLPYLVQDAAAKRAGEVDGKHFTERIEELDRLRREKDDDAQLELLLKSIHAAERQAKAERTPPAPAYTERASVIYRRRKDYVAEIDVINRWLRRAEEAERGRDSVSKGEERLRYRLERANVLQAKKQRDAVGQESQVTGPDDWSGA